MAPAAEKIGIYKKADFQDLLGTVSWGVISELADLVLLIRLF